MSYIGLAEVNVNEVWMQIRQTWHHSIFISSALTLFNSWEYFKDGKFLLTVLNFLSTIFFVFYLLFVLATKIDLSSNRVEKSRLYRYTGPFFVSNVFWLVCFSLICLGNALFLDRNDLYYRNLFAISIVVFNFVAVVDLIRNKGLKSELLFAYFNKMVRK